MYSDRYRNEEWLREQYHGRGRTMEEIADEVGCSATTVSNWLDMFDIPTKKIRIDADLLREKYVEQGKTLYEIGDELGYSHETIRRLMEHHNIQRRDNRHRSGALDVSVNNNGHETFMSGHDNIKYECSVHQLCAIAWGMAEPAELFTGGGLHVHHRNHIPWDNREDNLDCLTPSEHRERHNWRREFTIITSPST